MALEGIGDSRPQRKGRGPCTRFEMFWMRDTGTWKIIGIRKEGWEAQDGCG